MIKIEITDGNQTFSVIPHTIELPDVRTFNESLQHEQQICKAAIVFDENILAFLLNGQNIQAGVYDDDTSLFSGIINNDLDFTDNGAPEHADFININIYDYTSKFDVACESEVALIGQKLSDIVEEICDNCDIACEAVFEDNPTVEAFVLGKEKKYLDSLNSILFQYGYIWFFNESGSFEVLKIDTETTAGTLTEADFLSGLQIKNSIKNYNAVKITYSRLTKKSNEQIYFEGNGLDSNNKVVPITLRPGQYYPYDSDPVQEAREGKVFQNFESAYAESYRTYSGEKKYRRAKNVALLYSENHYVVQDWTGQIVIDRTEFCARSSAVRFHNTGSEDASLMQFAIRADAWYRSLDNSVTTGNGKKEYTYEAEYVYDSETASNLASLCHKFFASKNIKISASINHSINVGSVYSIDTGTSGIQTRALVLSCSYNPETQLYSAELLSVSDISVAVSRYKNCSSQDGTSEILTTVEKELDEIKNGSLSIDNPDAPNPNSLTAIAEENGISVKWNPITSNGLKNSVKQYNIEISKDSGVTWNPLTSVFNSDYFYVFNRAQDADGYPEASVFNTWQFRLRTENVYGKYSQWVTITQINVSLYKTWIPSAPVITKKRAEENGISFEWNDVSNCYGNNYFTIDIPNAEGAIPQTLDSPRFYYSFLRNSGNTLKDGYPEANDLASWGFTITVINCQTGRHSDTTENVDISEYLGWLPNTPAVETRSSGRTCTLAPINTERRYGKIMYKIMVCNPAIDYGEDGGKRTYKYYLPKPTSDPFGNELNYKQTTTVQPQENVPFLSDSPYSQTMPLKDQSATTYKRYSFKNGSNPLDYDNGTTKLLIYTDTQPPSGATQEDVYIDGVLVENAYCWTDSVNNLNYISFEVSMPSPKDTIYWWKVAAYNAATENIQSKTSPYVEAQSTAFATSAYDVVKNGITENALAPDAVTTDKIAAGTITANKIFVEALSAISANLGAITDGSLVGNQNNYWYLTDEYEGATLVHRAGDFRVGGSSGGDYISCTTTDGTYYHVEIHATKFDITAVGTVVKGAFYVAPSDATVNPQTGIPGTYYAKIDSTGVIINENVTILGGSFGIKRSATDVEDFLNIDPKNGYGKIEPFRLTLYAQHPELGNKFVGLKYHGVSLYDSGWLYTETSKTRKMYIGDIDQDDSLAAEGLCLSYHKDSVTGKYSEFRISPDLGIGDHEDEPDGSIIFYKHILQLTHSKILLYATEITAGPNGTFVGPLKGVAEKCTGNPKIINSSSTQDCIADTRFIVTSNKTLTLGTSSTEGVIAEVFAVTDCTVSYGSNTLSMPANTRATFLYHSGWKYYGLLGAVWN